MARYIIEVSHEADEKACAVAVEILLRTGSHYLTNAEWGCMDGDHRGWIIVEADSREEARSVLPPLYRPQARIVKLNRFSLDEIDEIIRHHAA